MRHMTQYEQYLPSKQTPTSTFQMNKSHAVKNCLVYRVDFINNRLSSTNRQTVHGSHKLLFKVIKKKISFPKRLRAKSI